MIAQVLEAIATTEMDTSCGGWTLWRQAVWIGESCVDWPKGLFVPPTTLPLVATQKSCARMWGTMEKAAGERSELIKHVDAFWASEQGTIANTDLYNVLECYRQMAMLLLLQHDRRASCFYAA